MENNKRKTSQKGWKFNLLDVVIIILIIAFVGASVAMLIPRVTDFFGNGGNVTVIYTVVFSEVDEDLLEAGAGIYDAETAKDKSTGRVLGTVIGDALLDNCYEFVIKDGTENKDVPSLESVIIEGKKSLTVTLTASATYKEGSGYEINGQRIACNTELDMIFPNFTGRGICTVVTEERG